MAANSTLRRVAGVGRVLAGLVSLAATVGLVVMLVKEWRAGTAFLRYRNWEGHLVSHADLLILIVAAPSALIVGFIWRWWDHRCEDRIAAEVRARRGKRTSAP